MDIRCRKTNCVFNDRFACQAKDILVNKNIICSTFEKSDKKTPDTSKTMFEKTPEYAPMRDMAKIDIDCKASCVFNNNGNCTANGITVNSIAEKPYCMTYIRR